MEPDPVLVHFLLNANRELYLAMFKYQKVRKQLLLNPSNSELRTKLEMLGVIVRDVGAEEKRLFNKCRAHPGLYKIPYANPLCRLKPKSSENEPNTNGITAEPTFKTTGVPGANEFPDCNPFATVQWKASVQSCRKVQLWQDRQMLSDETAETADFLPLVGTCNSEECLPHGDTRDTMTQKNWLELFNLEPSTNALLRSKRRAERKKRSTENPQFVYEWCNKEGNSEELDEFTKVVSPIKTPRKRGRPRVKPLDNSSLLPSPSSGQHDEKVEGSLPDSLVKIPKKRGRPPIKKEKTETIETIETVAKIAITRLKRPDGLTKEPKKMSRRKIKKPERKAPELLYGSQATSASSSSQMEPGSSSDCLKSPASGPPPRRILPKKNETGPPALDKPGPSNGNAVDTQSPYAERMVEPVASTSADFKGFSEEESSRAEYIWGNNMIPLTLYQGDSNIPVSGGSPIFGELVEESSHSSDPPMAICKVCLKDFIKLTPNTDKHEVKCFECRNLMLSGTN